MNINETVKKVSKISEVIIVIFFFYFIISESWENAFFIALLYMMFWQLPKWYRNHSKN